MISPLAPTDLPELSPLPGVVVRTSRAGYKDWDRADLTVIELPEGTSVAGVFTTSRCPAPEIEWCRDALARGTARALIVNAGNANAFTGGRGREAVEGIVAFARNVIRCDASEVFVNSTGVIGVPLPLDKATAGLDAAFAAKPGAWEDAARAIGTTDTFPKLATASAVVGGRTVTMHGIIKGSGMIAPDMATMLGYVFTDAKVTPAFLQSCLSRVTKRTFNCITVDSDTSTSDTVLAFATGTVAGPALDDVEAPGADAFMAALEDLCLELAHLVVRDGEGASKFIEVAVTGAESDPSARTVAMSIANSPLVKTAIAGQDANWGRVVMAVGKAGEPADRDLLSIRFGGVEVARDGMVVPQYDEAPVSRHLEGKDIAIAVDLGIGPGAATVWTCDLTHGYISINADYRS